jgi:hypothetical protein
MHTLAAKCANRMTTALWVRSVWRNHPQLVDYEDEKEGKDD